MLKLPMLKLPMLKLPMLELLMLKLSAFELFSLEQFVELSRRSCIPVVLLGLDLELSAFSN